MASKKKTDLPDLVGRVDIKKVESILAEIERRKKEKRDYISPARHLTVNDKGDMTIGGVKCFMVGPDNPDARHDFYTDWQEAEAAADPDGYKIVPCDGWPNRPMSRLAETQLAGRLIPGSDRGLPIKYVDDLRAAGYHDLAGRAFSDLCGKSDSKFLVRLLDGKVRAVLSNSYRVMDDADVFFAAADTFQQADAVIWDARLWDNGFEILAVSKSIHGEVNRQFDDAKGAYHHVVAAPGGHDYGKPDVNTPPDVHNALVKVTNSETGSGGLNVWFGALTRACNNTLVLGRGISIIHVGKKNEHEGLVYSDETQAAESEVIWLKLRDAIKTAFNEKKFAEYVEKASGLTRRKLEDPELAVGNVTREYQLNEDRRASILRSLYESRDLTAYGLMQAVTSQVKDADEEESGILEIVGGKILEASGAQLVALGA